LILEGFEIENWSCIARATVTELPPAGVAVLHGPNGTGKSSIIQALRACLMDFASSSTAKELKRWFPKNSSEKPRVRVSFRAQGSSWRISKQFGSKESSLERRVASGAWKLEKATAADAHEAMRQLTGAKDSGSGLHQLLWLTQAEFHLPDPGKFDPDVQSQLRAVLGVLQTPLDDRFLGVVKENWSRWFGARSKPGEKPRLKKDCPLERARAALELRRLELEQIECEYKRNESMMVRSADLEVATRELRRQLTVRLQERELLQEEYEKSRSRLEAHRLALERLGGAQRILGERQALRQRRGDYEARLREAETAAGAARGEIADRACRLSAAEEYLHRLRKEAHELRERGRRSQGKLSAIGERRQLLAVKDQLKTAQENLLQTERAAATIDELQSLDRERPAPDLSTLETLEANRARATRLRADLEAAAIVLTVIADAGSPAAQLEIDGTVATDPAAAGCAPVRHAVRRRAEVTIPGWGRLELMRGLDARTVDQIESDLDKCERTFAAELEPFGVPAADPAALDRLRGRAAEKQARAPQLERWKRELDRLAPKGLNDLRQEVARLERSLASRSSGASQLELQQPDLPTTAEALDKLGGQVKAEIERIELETREIERQQNELLHRIDGDRDRSRDGEGLRRQVAAASERLASIEAAAKLHRGELERLPLSEQLEEEVRAAEGALDTAHKQVQVTKLNESEESVRQRLDDADEALRALQAQITEADREFHQLRGALSQTEGLHQKRAAAAAALETLTRQVERETLESEAYDRLYALFEECREKQFGAVLGPIHDRVVGWMRLLRISDYQSIRFNDQFLPRELIAGDGTTGYLIGEESTGTIEQIGLMVRLALGSMLSTPDEPVAAVLDDPLTHSDAVRLDRMRAVLRCAAAGNPGSTPPAGPLQILVFTCHPEWFRMDGARMIDLANPSVLERR
jgi:DNA repair exonuclease SbcCD ATPase subunit